MSDSELRGDKAHLSRFSLLCALAVVFIVCSGNAAGILFGAILWKLTGQVTAAVLVFIGLTALGLLLGLTVLLILQKRRRTEA